MSCKASVACLTVLLILTTCVAAFAQPTVEGDWTPIPELTDEFDGAALDAEKWHDHNPTWTGREPGWFSKDNVQVRDGKLTLTARAEDLPDVPERYHTFTTAAVRSKAKVRYGYFEIKCKPMDSRASSAFWFYDQAPSVSNIDWWTEIDVFEICGGCPDRDHSYYMTLHVWVTPEVGEDHWSKHEEWKAPFRLGEDFHTYGFLWTNEVLRWYVDGEPVHELENTHWHQPLTMNFDSETMPEWFGLPDPENLPSTFSIEYIRSWREQE